jgi:hypothetical protein
VPKMEQTAPAQTQWSTAVEAADWIAAALAPFEEGLVASVIPRGFAAYARVLNPARAARGRGTRPVRWREIAQWSGVPLHPDSQFHSIALPPQQPAGPPPWNGQGPERGSLDLADAEALIELLQPHTSTPEACLFCMWDGWGWDTAMYVALPGEPPIPLPDPVPPEVRYGPRVRLPGRDYLLYTGPADAALAFAGSPGQTPNLWWPADRAWCVASEVDLSWSYVGGPAGLIDELIADQRLEALPAVTEHAHSWVEGYIVESAERAAADLVATGQAGIETAGGTIRATLRRPGRLGRVGTLRIQSADRGGVGSRAEHRLAASGPDEPRDEIVGYLTMALTGLVED